MKKLYIILFVITLSFILTGCDEKLEDEIISKEFDSIEYNPIIHKQDYLYIPGGTEPLYNVRYSFDDFNLFEKIVKYLREDGAYILHDKTSVNIPNCYDDKLIKITYYIDGYCRCENKHRRDGLYKSFDEFLLNQCFESSSFTPYAACQIDADSGYRCSYSRSITTGANNLYYSENYISIEYNNNTLLSIDLINYTNEEFIENYLPLLLTKCGYSKY